MPSPTRSQPSMPEGLSRLEDGCAYIYDLDGLRTHVRDLVAALPADVELFYAMKANAQLPVLRALSPLVAGLEVASGGELRKAIEVAPDGPLIFGGPGKTDGELEEAVRQPVHLLHVESLHELRRAQHVAARLGGVLRVLLRVNLRDSLPPATLRMAGTTQFGIDEAMIEDALHAARDCPNLELAGLHFHSISNQRDADTHAELIKRYISRARAWFEAVKLPLQVINVGGGIGVDYGDPAWRFDWPKLMRRLETMPGRPPRLLFECGRMLTAHCGVYAAEVIDVKHNHGTTWVIVRGGSHHFRLPSSWNHSHPFRIVARDEWPYPFTRPSAQNTCVNIVGQLCTPKDRLASNAPIERVRAGDVIVFEMAGAYGWEISHDRFLGHPAPALVYLG